MATSGLIAEPSPKVAESGTFDVQGFRFGARLPFKLADGSMNPELLNLLGDLPRLAQDAPLRMATQAMMILGGLAGGVLITEMVGGTPLFLILTVSALLGLFGYLERRSAGHLLLPVSRATLQVGRRTIRWSEGMEIGYVDYADVQHVSVVPTVAADGRPAEMILLEDRLGKRLALLTGDSATTVNVMTRIVSSDPNIASVPQPDNSPP